MFAPLGVCVWMLTQTPNPLYGPGIMTSPTEVTTCPDFGTPWNNVVAWANNDGMEDDTDGILDFADQEENDDTVILAMAIKGIAADPDDRTLLRDAAVMILDEIGTTNNIGDGGMQWPQNYGRNVAPCVVAWYDLIIRAVTSPPVVTLTERQRMDSFVDWLPTHEPGGKKSLAENHMDRCNNIGGVCGFTVLCCYVARHVDASVITHIKVLRGFLGDAGSNGHAFSDGKFGECGGQVCKEYWPDNPESSRRPVNPFGAKRNGFDLNGCLCDDQRRGGTICCHTSTADDACFCFEGFPYHKTIYYWEGEQGLSCQVVLAHRLEYNSFSWSTDAWQRSLDWITDPAFGNNPVRRWRTTTLGPTTRSAA